MKHPLNKSVFISFIISAYLYCFTGVSIAQNIGEYVQLKLVKIHNNNGKIESQWSTPNTKYKPHTNKQTALNT